jgi:hypothetical protein
MVRLVGRILLADGKPSRGDVELYPARNGKSMGAGVPQTRSQLDAEGRFEFRLPVGGPYLLRAVNLTHEGHNGSRGTSPKKAPGGFDAFHPTKDLTIEPDKPVDLGTFNADTGQPADQAE